MPAAVNAADQWGMSWRFAPPTSAASHSPAKSDRRATATHVSELLQAVFSASDGPRRSKR